MQEDLGRANSNGTNSNVNAGHQSEPSTPPEYRDTNSGFPTVFSRPNRYSTSSLTSPPGLYNRPGRSGSQLTSPQSGFIPSRYVIDDKMPSRSVPGSRRNSDEDEKEEAVRQDPTSHRSTNAYVLPIFTPPHNIYDFLSRSSLKRTLLRTMTVTNVALHSCVRLCVRWHPSISCMPIFRPIGHFLTYNYPLPRSLVPRSSSSSLLETIFHNLHFITTLFLQLPLSTATNPNTSSLRSLSSIFTAISIVHLKPKLQHCIKVLHCGRVPVRLFLTARFVHTPSTNL